MTLTQTILRWEQAEQTVSLRKAEALAAFRPFAGKIRVRELARRADVSPSTITRLLAGDPSVGVGAARRIAEHLPACLSSPYPE